MNNGDWTPALVAALCEHLGSRAELARRMRVGPVTVWRWETGRSALRDQVRYQLTNIARRNGFKGDSNDHHDHA